MTSDVPPGADTPNDNRFWVVSRSGWPELRELGEADIAELEKQGYQRFTIALDKRPAIVGFTESATDVDTLRRVFADIEQRLASQGPQW